MKLYENPLSPNARRALLVIEHLGLDVEIKLLDFMKGEHKAPDFLKLNPNGKVPVLVDGDFVLTESRAIMQYLAAQKPDSGLLPTDEKGRADVARWQFWDAAHFSPQLGTIAFERLMKPMMGLGEPDHAAIERAEKELARFATVLDGHLAARRHVVGDQLTIADLTLASSLTYVGPSGVSLDPYPQLKSWLGRISELDAWRKTAPKPS
jgi:glutathione S-transferase